MAPFSPFALRCAKKDSYETRSGSDKCWNVSSSDHLLTCIERDAPCNNCALSLRVETALFGLPPFHHDPRKASPVVDSETRTIPQRRSYRSYRSSAAVAFGRLQYCDFSSNRVARKNRAQRAPRTH